MYLYARSCSHARTQPCKSNRFPHEERASAPFTYTTRFQRFYCSGSRPDRSSVKLNGLAHKRVSLGSHVGSQGFSSARPELNRRGDTVITNAGSGSFIVDFPSTEAELMSQVQTSVQAALADGCSLLEVEVPIGASAGPGVTSGDCIAISEYNANMQMLRQFCELFEWLGQDDRVRVFFPDSGEASIALNGIGMNPVSGQWEQPPTFDDWGGKVDYLLRDDFLQQTSNRMSGYADLDADLAGKAEVAEKLLVDDAMYVIGYPYDNTEEMVSVMRLWEAHARRTVIFNGNLDSIRTGFFPWGKGKRLKQEFLPQVEAAYYCHFFKSSTQPGMLFRAYPGPWRVLRARPQGGFECVQETPDRPTLKDVALTYFSGGLTTQEIATSTTPQVPLSDDNQLYYKRLGLDQNAPQEDISVAYRQMVRTAHPDKGGDTMVFYEINKAYAVLKDPVTRAQYDEYGERWVEVREEKKTEARP